MYSDDLQIVCFYKNSESKILQRTYWISEIKRGDHLDFISLVPGFKFVGYAYPEFK